MKFKRSLCHSRNDQSGFARRDLLALVAMVLIVACVQAPVLGRNHVGDQAARCRDNLRQLVLAWQMYSADNHGELVRNQGSDPNHLRGTWAPGWLDFTSSYDNINSDYLIGFAKTGNYGHLGPYLKGAEAFRCPADTSAAVIFGRQVYRVRTISMNNWMAGTNLNAQTGFRVFMKESDISGLPPSQAWVIQDEREDSINDSRFEVDMQEAIAAYPGSYHGGGGFLSYADGHVEHNVWRDPRTNPELIKSVLLPLNVASPGNPDLNWLRARSTVAD